MLVNFGSLVELVSEKKSAESSEVETYVSTNTMLPNFGGIQQAVALPATGGVTIYRPGDTLFSNIRTYFRKVWQADRSGTCSTNVLVFRSKNTDKLINEFLFHLCRWDVFTKFTVQTSRGSTIPRGDKEAIKRFQFHLPPIKVQREISATLGALDDKIDLNRRMNETLEAMARALFKDWFVDFGPTRAKMAGRKPYLAPEIWKLFPNKLDNSGKPQGWQMGNLGEIADTPKRRDINPADMAADTPYIGLEHMPRRSIALTEWGCARKVTSRKLTFKKGEFLFGKLSPSYHKAGVAPLNGICSTDIVVIVPRELHWTAFALICLSSDEFMSYAIQTSTGTIMPRTSWKAMKQYGLYLPPQQVAQAFQNLIQPLLDRIDTNIHENHTLAQTRDFLLPKLISGEISIRDTDKAIQAR